MPWDDWRVNLNKKLDDFGEDAMRKVRQQREAGGGVGVRDRLSMAKGETPAWNRDVDRRAAGAGAQHDAQPSSMSVSVPRPPPPPPPRSASGSGSGSGSGAGALPTSNAGYIHFSQFTQQDKQEFFNLLDEVRGAPIGQREREKELR